MNQTQPPTQVVLVVEDPDRLEPATTALTRCEGIRWTELQGCEVAAKWLLANHADVVLLLLSPSSYDGLILLRRAWHGPLICLCNDNEKTVRAVEDAHGLAILPPFNSSQIASAIKLFVRLHKPLSALYGDDPYYPMQNAGTQEDGEMGALLQSEMYLEQAQRMEAVGRMAGGIAHDFNNLLTVIGSYSDLALRKLEAEHTVKRYVEQIRKATTTAATLTRQLLAFSRRQVMQPRTIQLNEIVDEVSLMAQSLLGPAIEMRMRLDPELGQIEADPVQVQQVLLNLIVNAKDAMPDGGLLSLETRNLEIDERYARQFRNMQPGAYVRLTVADTGIGMDKATLTHIFEPFFTTKPKGMGTGLGLSTVHGIVQQSRGQISVYSEVGKGTTFHIYLPRVDKQTNYAPSAADGSDGLRGRETILLVEDEDAVRQLASLVLEEAGYHLLTAATPEEAIAMEANFGGQIDLLLTDVIMPRMTGREVAIIIRHHRSHLPVVYMSGYTQDVMAFQRLIDDGALLVEKPFYPHELLRIVRRAIDQAKICQEKTDSQGKVETVVKVPAPTLNGVGSSH